MKIRPSYIIALSLFVAIILWFVFADVSQKQKTAQNSAITAEKTDSQTDNNENYSAKLVVKTIKAKEHQSYITFYGQSEADRQVSVKAQTNGLVVETPVREGAFVKKGDLLCKQDIDARAAALDQARALLKTRELEYEAAKTLVKKGYRSETAAQAAKAALDGAKAALKQAEIELDNIEIRAPFSGIFERRLAETGDYLGPGQPCGLLLDLNPLVITAEVGEKQIKYIKRGQWGEVNLATGQNVKGKIRLIEARANPKTRTFRIELAVNNADYKLKSGTSANIRLGIGKTKAHFIPSRVLTLNDEGIIGVKTLDTDDIVRFVPVTTIDENNDGIWVSGLADTTRLIVQGQDYVREGIKANVIKVENDGYSE